MYFTIFREFRAHRLPKILPTLTNAEEPKVRMADPEAVRRLPEVQNLSKEI